MKKIYLLIVIIVVILSSCSSGSTISKIPETPKPTSTATNIPNPTIANTPNPTNTPIITFTPTPEQGLGSAPISVENISRLTRLTSLGEGDLLGIQISPDNKWLVLNSSTGLLILDSLSLKKVAFLPTAMKPDEITWMDGGNQISVRNCDQGYIWSIPDGKEISHVFFSIKTPGLPNLGGCKENLYSDWENAIVRYPNDQKIHFYQISSGKSLYTIDYEPYRIAVSPDKQTLVLSTVDKLVFMQYQDGKVLKEFTEKGIEWLFFYPDGKTLAAVFENQTKFWSLDDFLLVDTVNGTGLGGLLYYHPIFSPDGTVLVFRKGGTFRFLRAEDRLVISALSGYGIKFTSDSQGVILDNGSGEIKYYQFNEDRTSLSRKYSVRGRGLGNIRYDTSIPGAISTDNTKLLSSKYRVSSLEEILIYDLGTGSVTHIDVDIRFTEILDAVWLPGKHTFGVFLGSHWNIPGFYIMDMNSKKLIKMIGEIPDANRSALAFSPESDLLYFARGDLVNSWDINKNNYRALQQVNIPYLFNENEKNMSPDSNYRISIEKKENIGFRESMLVTINGEFKKELSGMGDLDFAFSADSRMIAISTFSMYGSKVSIFDLSSGEQLFSTGDYFSEGDSAPKVAFSPDGKYFSILPEAGFPQIWGIP